MGLPSHGLTTCGMGQEGQMYRELGVGQRPWWFDPRLQQTLGTCDVTSLARKEPELFCSVKKFRVDLVGFTSTKGLLSGLLERDWTPFHSRVAHVERHRAFLARYLYIGVHPDG